MEGQELLEPVYFLNTDVTDRAQQIRITEYQVCMATIETIDKDLLRGVERSGNLWRIHVKTVQARTTLAVNGIDLLGKHVSIQTINPYVKRNDRDQNDRPNKITIKGVKMIYPNLSIEKILSSVGIKLVSPMQYCKIKDNERHDTEFICSDREVLAEPTSVKNHPLPQWMYIGGCVAQIRHYGQPKTQPCSRCLKKDHPTWRCHNAPVCRVCLKPNHREGNEACPYYVRDNGAKVFGGRKDILSNFHTCYFTYNKFEYRSREQAYQHQKALYCKDFTVAEAILNATDPGEAKSIAKCVSTNNIWEKIEVELMEDICYHAAIQNDEYYNELLDTNDQYLVEGVPYQHKWGSGLSYLETISTQIEHLPGENKLGHILMKIRKRLIDEKKGTQFVAPKHTRRANSATIDELTTSIDESYNKFCALPNNEGNQNQKQYNEKGKKRQFSSGSSVSSVFVHQPKMTKHNEEVADNDIYVYDDTRLESVKIKDASRGNGLTSRCVPVSAKIDNSNEEQSDVKYVDDTMSSNGELTVYKL